MADKIQFENEEQFEEAIALIMGKYSGYSITELKNNARKHGYFKKSLLQQKVEEAEKIWVNFCVNDLQDDLHCIQHDIIQLFKEKYPEDFI